MSRTRKRSNLKDKERDKRTDERLEATADSKSKRINFDNARASRVGHMGWCLTKNTDNDQTWYAKNKMLLDAAASVAFSNTTGMPIGFDGDTTAAGIPGIMALHYLPYVGVGTGAIPMNQSKEMYYSDVVHANSRNTSYSANDLMIVTLAGMQIFSAIETAIRVYGTMKLVDGQTYYAPANMVNALGFNYNDLRAHLSDMWFDINDWIVQSRQIWVPDIFPLLKRWMWMNSNIYMDSDSPKGQYYVFVQDGYLAYSETTNEAGGELLFVNPDGTLQQKKNLVATDANYTRYSAATTKLTWNQFKTIINTMFSQLLNSTYRGVIMGDVLKCFGENAIFALTEIPSDYKVSPSYNQEVLSQIENATVFHGQYYSVSPFLDTNAIETGWLNAGNTNSTVIAADTYSLLRNVPTQSVLNFHFRGQPTPGQVMVATRLKVAGVQQVETRYAGEVQPVAAALAPAIAGSEYVYTIIVYTMQNNTLIGSDYWTQVSAAGYNAESILAQITNEIVFDWCPWIYYTDSVQAESGKATIQSKVIKAYGDYDNSIVLDQLTLWKMHNAALFSEFNVPTI